MTSPILRHFSFDHLQQPMLRAVSKRFHDLAHALEDELPDGAEKSTALRKLLEGKDAAIRASHEGFDGFVPRAVAGFDTSNVDVVAARATPDPYPTASWQSPEAFPFTIEETRGTDRPEGALTRSELSALVGEPLVADAEQAQASLEAPRTHVFIRRIDEKAFRDNWTGGGRLVFHSTQARTHEGERYGLNDHVIIDMANAGAGLEDVIRRNLFKCGLTWDKTVTEIEL